MYWCGWVFQWHLSWSKMIHSSAALTIASVCSLFPPNSLLPHVFHHFYLSSLVCSHFAAFPIIRCATVLAAAAAAASQHIPTLDTFLPNDGKNLCSRRHHHCPRITTVTKMLDLLTNYLLCIWLVSDPTYNLCAACLSSNIDRSEMHIVGTDPLWENTHNIWHKVTNHTYLYDSCW